MYLTQSISNYLDVMPGERSEHATHSLLGNLATKIFHSNSDVATNEYASNLIGKNWRFGANISGGSSTDPLRPFYAGDASQQGVAFHEHLDLEVLPRDFATLRTGGVANGFLVDGVVVQSGRQWQANGRTYLPVVFDQNA